MKTYSFILLVLLVLCSCQSAPYDPGEYISGMEREKMISQIVHYAAKLPPTGTFETRFDPKFKSYYDAVAADYKLMYMTPARGDSRYYFLVSKPARSIHPLWESIGGELQYDANDSLVFYNEIFRTWKLPEEDMKSRGLMLFEHMIQGKDLSLYYSKFAGDKYIEFPDEHYYFDTTKRVWKNNEIDSLVRGDK